MPAPRRKNLIASRRRRQDDGEEEDSVVGDYEDDSLSEASAISNGDGPDAAGSDSSDDGQESVKQHQRVANNIANHEHDEAKDLVLPHSHSSEVNGKFKPSAENQALLHGVKSAEHSQPAEEIQFNELPPPNETASVASQVAVPTAPRNETFTQRARREHQEYIQQRNANPAFVPTRGGFFLHDDRNANTNGPPRPVIRGGRGRGYSTVLQAG